MYNTCHYSNWCLNSVAFRFSRLKKSDPKSLVLGLYINYFYWKCNLFRQFNPNNYQKWCPLNKKAFCFQFHFITCIGLTGNHWIAIKKTQILLIISSCNYIQFQNSKQWERFRENARPSLELLAKKVHQNPLCRYFIVPNMHPMLLETKTACNQKTSDPKN